MVKEYKFYGTEKQAQQIAADLLALWTENPARPPIYVKFMDAKIYKTDKQNSTFHGLLDIYWESGLSSYADPEKMRSYYKSLAGLIKHKFIKEELPLTLIEKKMLYAVVERLPFSTIAKQAIYKALRGESSEKKECSWSDASKKGAIVALDCLINDMIASGVNSDRFNRAMQDITKGSWEL